MNDDEFWELIATARREAGDDCEAHTEAVKHLLMQRPLDDVLAYDRLFRRAMRDAYRYDLWGAIYLIQGGCSDDGFEYFRGWLILQGREVYTNALRDPESLAAVVGDERDRFECECMIYVASQVHEERTGDGNPAFNHVAESDYSEPEGTQWDDDDLPRLYPALWASHGW